MMFETIRKKLAALLYPAEPPAPPRVIYEPRTIIISDTLGHCTFYIRAQKLRVKQIYYANEPRRLDGILPSTAIAYGPCRERETRDTIQYAEDLGFVVHRITELPR